MNRPNILLITTDQQRWDAVGVNGNAAIRTPHLDRLGRNGLRFTNSFCAAAACQPSRASILTGTCPNVHGVTVTGTKQWVRPELATLPGVLTDHGYRTAGVGKMHFEPWDALCGFQQRVIIESKYFGGPDEYRCYVRERRLADRAIGHHVPGFGQANKGMPSRLPEDDHIDAFIGRRGVETLRELVETGDKPFSLWLSFCGPHDPYDPPEPYASMFQPAKMPLPRRAKNELDRLPPVVRKAATAFGIEKMNLWGIPDTEIQRLRALYYGNVALIDTWIGRVWELLDTQGVADNTLIIFTSDHGDYLGDHDLLWKGLLPSDADMKVPLLMGWPGRIKPAVREGFATGVDLMPTILAAAVAPIPEQCQGHNLLGPHAARDHVTLFSEPNKWRYRDGRWSYTWWPDQPFDTLYDLTTDPSELDNLCFGQDAPPAEARRLRRKILQTLGRNI